MALFRRRRTPDVVAPGRRAGLGTVAEQLAALRLSRGTADTITVDQLPIVQGLAQLHADVIAQFPLYAEDRDGFRVVKTPDILEQPDPTEPLGDTLHALVQSLWYTGNAYGLFDGAAMRVQNPNYVSLQPPLDSYDDRRIDGWYVHGQPVDTEHVAHFKINDDPRHGPLGASPLTRCWQAVENYAWAYRYLADYYLSGGNPSLMLKSRNATDPAQSEELWMQWVAARKAGRPAVVPFDVDVVASPAPPDIDQTVTVLGFCAGEICRATNTPPSLGNAPVQSDLTYATTLDELRRWLVLSLGPTWLVRIERGFTALLPAGMRARFDVTELPRLDVFGAAPAADTPAAVPPVAAITAGPHRLEVVA